MVLLNPFLPRAAEVMLPDATPAPMSPPAYRYRGGAPAEKREPLPPLPQGLRGIATALAHGFLRCAVQDATERAAAAGVTVAVDKEPLLEPAAGIPASMSGDRGPLILNLCRSVLSEGWCRTLADFGRTYSLTLTASSAVAGSLQVLLDRSVEDALLSTSTDAADAAEHPEVAAERSGDAVIPTKDATERPEDATEPVGAAPFSYPYCIGVSVFVAAQNAWSQELRKMLVPAGREAALYEMFLRHVLNRRGDHVDTDAVDDFPGSDASIGLPSSSTLAEIASSPHTVTSPNVAVDGDTDGWETVHSPNAHVPSSFPVLMAAYSTHSASGEVLPGELERMLGDAAGQPLVSMAAEACAPEQDALMLLLLALYECDRARRRVGDAVMETFSGAHEEAGLLMAMLSAPSVEEHSGSDSDGIPEGDELPLARDAMDGGAVHGQWAAVASLGWAAVVRGAATRAQEPSHQVIEDGGRASDSSPASSEVAEQPAAIASLALTASSSDHTALPPAPLLSGVIGALTVPPHVFALPHPFPQSECGRHVPSPMTHSFLSRPRQHNQRKPKSTHRGANGFNMDDTIYR